MNKKILIVLFIIVLLLVVVVAYFYPKTLIDTNSSMEGHNMADMSTGPADQSHRGYVLDITSDTNGIQPGRQATITYMIKNDRGEVIKNFDVVHEKIMHFISVRKDLQDFQHLHPTFNEATGEFSVDVIFPENGPYRIFPDFTPGDDNPQNLPVTVFKDIEVGDITNYKAQEVEPDNQAQKTYGDYTVSFGFNPQQPKKQEDLTYRLDISKDGNAVTNLENYLGALGHTVIIKEGSLDFIHTHALEGSIDGGRMEGHDMGAMTQEEDMSQKGPQIDFATSFPEEGVYKSFTQFQHEGKVQTVDYIFKIN